MDGFLIAIGLVCFGLCFDNAIGNLARVIGMAAKIIAAAVTPKDNKDLP